MAVKPKAEVPAEEVIETTPAVEPEPETPAEEPEAEAEVETPPEAEPEPEAQVDPIIAAERQRVAAIMELQRPGAEQIIRDAIASDATPGDVAQAILKSPEVRNAATLRVRSADASLLDVVPGVAAPDTEDPKAQRISRIAAFLNRRRGVKE